MHHDIQRFIEQMGLLWVEEGFTRIAGRIYALALVSSEPCSLEQIAVTLKVSKPSVSNDARMLHRMGLIERVGMPGDRRDYYQLTRDSIERSIETRIVRMEAFQKTMSTAATLPIEDREVHRRIEAQILANEAVIEALRKVVATLQSSNPAATSRPRSSRK
jgi:DNA-binding transcriptional regulator GbsR (MarR family)